MECRPLHVLPIILILAVSFCSSCPVAAEEPCLRSAWAALNVEDYTGAIKAADLCIDTFGRAADRQEAKLQKDGLPITEPGPPPTEIDKNRIFRQGVLNDVAAAYFIKGKAAEAQARKRFKNESERTNFRRIATESYETACRYKHALTWDPRTSSFWSPCEAASDRLPLR
jgi:hypothetical protein